MEIIAVRKDTASQPHIALLREMHRLRARVFGSRLGWSVAIHDDEEFDEFDALNPTYILAVTGDRRVLGCARLLPTTGPTMLQDTFSQLLSGGHLPARRFVVESSRFCVDTAAGEGRGDGQIHDATMAIFAGIVEWCLNHGYSQIATCTDVRFERILRRAGWPMQRLGEPQMINETMSVAGILPANETSFVRLRPATYHSAFHSAQIMAA